MADGARGGSPGRPPASRMCRWSKRRPRPSGPPPRGALRSDPFGLPPGIGSSPGRRRHSPGSSSDSRSPAFRGFPDTAPRRRGRHSTPTGSSDRSAPRSSGPGGHPRLHRCPVVPVTTACSRRPRRFRSTAGDVGRHELEVDRPLPAHREPARPRIGTGTIRPPSRDADPLWDRRWVTKCAPTVPVDVEHRIPASPGGSTPSGFHTCRTAFRSMHRPPSGWIPDAPRTGRPWTGQLRRPRGVGPPGPIARGPSTARVDPRAPAGSSRGRGRCDVEGSGPPEQILTCAGTR